MVGMKYWITFNYQNNGRVDKIGACVDGLTVERWWGNHKMPTITLTREYPWSKISSLHPMKIQQGVFQVAGMEALNISDLQRFQSDKTWEEICK